MALEKLNGELEAKVQQRTLELELANKQLHHQAETDFLTKLPNRFAFNRCLDEKIRTNIQQSELGKVDSMTVSIAIASLQGGELNATDLLTAVP